MNPLIFVRFGFYLEPAFFSRAHCAELCEQMRQGGDKARVYSKSTGLTLNEGTRKTKQVFNLPPDLSKRTEEYFDGIMPRLSKHFKLELTREEPVQYLRYETGDFFHAHCDNREDAVDPINRRVVSTVVFLNEPGPVGGDVPGFTGGNLIFCDLLPRKPDDDEGLPLKPQTGLMVSFPSDQRHEVSRVTEGQRFSAVAWFHRKKAEGE
jgi:SM-20-related protein